MSNSLGLDFASIQEYSLELVYQLHHQKIEDNKSTFYIT